MSNLNFFDLMTVINGKTKIEWTEEIESAFNTFMVNKGYSQFPDSVLVANELNQFPDLDKKMVFYFYYYVLPKAKRFGKWDKAMKQSEDEEMLIEYFGISRDKVPEMVKTLDLVSPEWRKELKGILDKGGRKK